MGKFEGKTVIVTGSSYGIGKGIAVSFGREGANVLVNYSRDRDKALKVVAEIEKSGGKAVAVKADVSRSGEVKEMVRKCMDTFGGIDVLVNNAGTNGRIAPVEELTEEDWDHVMAVNLKGNFLCTSAVLPHFLKNGKGRIINMGSVDSFVGDVNFSAYVATKGGVAAFTRALSLELGPRHITVNAICPGFVETPSADNIEKLYPGTKSAVVKRVPTGRLLTPQDIGNVALFLASDEAEMVNGACVVIDGGNINNIFP
jgi:NAD(P)-dependent dehydrogenase (short-subunit alcohol dehydrogenase family)